MFWWLSSARQIPQVRWLRKWTAHLSSRHMIWGLILVCKAPNLWKFIPESLFKAQTLNMSKSNSDGIGFQQYCSCRDQNINKTLKCQTKPPYTAQLMWNTLLKVRSWHQNVKSFSGFWNTVLQLHLYSVQLQSYFILQTVWRADDEAFVLPTQQREINQWLSVVRDTTDTTLKSVEFLTPLIILHMTHAS